MCFELKCCFVVDIPCNKMKMSNICRILDWTQVMLLLAKMFMDSLVHINTC